MSFNHSFQTVESKHGSHAPSCIDGMFGNYSTFSLGQESQTDLAQLQGMLSNLSKGSPVRNSNIDYNQIYTNTINLLQALPQQERDNVLKGLDTLQKLPSNIQDQVIATLAHKSVVCFENTLVNNKTLGAEQRFVIQDTVQNLKEAAKILEEARLVSQSNPQHLGDIGTKLSDTDPINPATTVAGILLNVSFDITDSGSIAFNFDALDGPTAAVLVQISLITPQGALSSVIKYWSNIMLVLGKVMNTMTTYGNAVTQLLSFVTSTAGTKSNDQNISITWAFYYYLQQHNPSLIGSSAIMVQDPNVDADKACAAQCGDFFAIMATALQNLMQNVPPQDAKYMTAAYMVNNGDKRPLSSCDSASTAYEYAPQQLLMSATMSEVNSAGLIINGLPSDGSEPSLVAGSLWTNSTNMLNGSNANSLYQMTSVEGVNNFSNNLCYMTLNSTNTQQLIGTTPASGTGSSAPGQPFLEQTTAAIQAASSQRNTVSANMDNSSSSFNQIASNIGTIIRMLVNIAF